MRNKTSNLRSLRAVRRELRRKATPQEVIVWARLKNRQLGCKFRRQHSFGKYIADFYCPERKLIVEIDGSQHMERKKQDDKRTKYFANNGLRVVRFWNNEINTNISDVISRIMGLLDD